MTRKTLHIAYHQLTADELDPSWKRLLEVAQQAMDTSYSPYSSFQVGAAILLDNGVILPGANQENAAFASCTCAEHIAVSSKASLYPDQSILKLAVVTSSMEDSPVAPCGNCRQILLQFENRQKQNIELLLAGKNKHVVIGSIRDLLPFSFDDFNFIIT